LSGIFKAAPEIRKTGRQQVGAMYCARKARSRRVACGKTETTGSVREENQRRLKGLRCMAGRLPRLAESCGKLQACCAELMALRGLLQLRGTSSGAEKRVDASA
jgi:hypothetical protein